MTVHSPPPAPPPPADVPAGRSSAHEPFDIGRVGAALVALYAALTIWIAPRPAGVDRAVGYLTGSILGGIGIALLIAWLWFAFPGRRRTRSARRTFVVMMAFFNMAVINQGVTGNRDTINAAVRPILDNLHSKRDALTRSASLIRGSGDVTKAQLLAGDTLDRQLALYRDASRVTREALDAGDRAPDDLVEALHGRGMADDVAVGKAVDRFRANLHWEPWRAVYAAQVRYLDAYVATMEFLKANRDVCRIDAEGFFAFPTADLVGQYNRLMRTLSTAEAEYQQRTREATDHKPAESAPVHG